MSTTTGSSARRRRLLGVSLKMYFSPSAAASYTSSLARLCRSAAKDIDIFILPDFISLPGCAAALSSSASSDADGIRLGAQTCSPHLSGAYTGDVSPSHLREVGVSIVCLGHAERRAPPHGETDAYVVAAARAVAEQDLTPLVCVGETEKPGGVASAAVGRAVEECRVLVRKVCEALPDDKEVVFAYEPVWAIGADTPAGADHVVAVVTELRRLTQGRKGPVRILYGGSAGPGTFEAIKGAVDGLFLGRFAHDIKNLEQVIREMSE